jgi:hypothetical protein
MAAFDSVVGFEKGMKELQVEKLGIQVNENLPPVNSRRTRVITRVTARAPACSACELPILSVVSRAPEAGTRTREVLKEVSTKWFNGLSEDDRKAISRLKKENS